MSFFFPETMAQRMLHLSTNQSILKKISFIDHEPQASEVDSNSFLIYYRNKIPMYAIKSIHGIVRKSINKRNKNLRNDELTEYFKNYVETDQNNNGAVSKQHEDEFIKLTLARDQQCPLNEVEFAMKLFDYHCKKYFGFGYLNSFIPGTEAFKARVNLSNETDNVMPSAKINLEEINKNIATNFLFAFFFRWGSKISTYGVIADLFMLGPLWRGLFYITAPLNNSVLKNHRPNSLESYLVTLPLIEIFLTLDDDSPSRRNVILRNRDDIVNKLFLYLRNPLYFVNDVINFIDCSLNYLINELFDFNPSSYITDSNEFQILLKGILAVARTIINIPVLTAISIVDFPYLIIKNYVYAPLKFLYLAFEQALAEEPSTGDEPPDNIEGFSPAEIINATHNDTEKMKLEAENESANQSVHCSNASPGKASASPVTPTHSYSSNSSVTLTFSSPKAEEKNNESSSSQLPVSMQNRYSPINPHF